MSWFFVHQLSNDFISEQGNLWIFGIFKYGVSTQQKCHSTGDSIQIQAIPPSWFDGPIVNISSGWTHCIVQSGMLIHVLHAPRRVSSPELKMQVSFYDCLLLSVCSFVCLWTFHIFMFFPITSKPISTKLDVFFLTKYVFSGRKQSDNMPIDLAVIICAIFASFTQ